MEHTLPPATPPSPLSGLQLAARLRAAGIHLSSSALAGATGRGIEQLKYLPLLARSSDWVALVDASSGEVVGHAPFDGF